MIKSFVFSEVAMIMFSKQMDDLDKDREIVDVDRSETRTETIEEFFFIIDGGLRPVYKEFKLTNKTSRTF